jgi:diadenosine tetraphosphate (Ap4A) HIT family hydrolase
MFSFKKAKNNMADTLKESNVPWDNLVREDFHVAVYKDKYPVTEGHLLFVPKYNTPAVIQDAFYDAYTHGLTLVEEGTCEGFNVGINYGKTAGQTIMYPHVHLILRRLGDCEDPTGGVRNVIPGKGNYVKN